MLPIKRTVGRSRYQTPSRVDYGRIASVSKLYEAFPRLDAGAHWGYTTPMLSKLARRVATSTG
jgi:hypothetical protein